jgi:NAD(P)-dependent dehydrogenase (short-subunit alcohol dehydrogenase family)
LPPLADRRVLLLGAETDLGRSAVTELAKSGARLALVCSTSESTSAFEVQRLARRVGALSQAIDAANEAAVRVMVRQVSKEMGGLDAAVSCVDDATARELFERHARREMKRTGEGLYVDAAATPDIVAAVAGWCRASRHVRQTGLSG